jgi:hypothetical protein
VNRWPLNARLVSSQSFTVCDLLWLRSLPCSGLILTPTFTPDDIILKVDIIYTVSTNVVADFYANLKVEAIAKCSANLETTGS